MGASHQTRTRWGLVFGAALSLALLLPASAAAANSGVTVTRFSASWGGDEYGQWQCDGIRLAKAGSHAFTEDLETCRVTGSLFTPGFYRSTGDEIVFPAPFDLGPQGWASDDDGAIATSWEVLFVPSRSGSLTAVIVATY